MQWLTGGFAALLMTALYYGTQYLVEKKYELNYKRTGRWITDRSVLAFGAISFAGILAVSILHLPEENAVAFIRNLILLWGMAVLAVIDKKKQLIPNQVLMLLFQLWVTVTGLYILFHVSEGVALLFRSLAGAIVSGIIFFACYLISRGQMGAGDVKLSVVLGLYLTGERIIGAILYGTLLCLLYSLIQLARKKLTLKSGVPMAPFLYLGTLITLLIL